MVLLYNIILSIFFPFFLVTVLFLSINTKKWRKGFFRKLGIYKKYSFNDTIVIHCVSVGETLAASGLIKNISQRFNKNIVLTTTTKTGFELANKNLKDYVNVVEFFPFDFPFSVMSFFDTFKPRCLIITETEIWPNIIFFARLKKIPVFIVNGRISERSYPKYIKFNWFFKSFLWWPFFLMQSEIDKERIINMGAREDKVIVTGSMKYDFSEIKVEISRQDFGILDDDIVLLAGSTHDGEEEVIINSFLEIKKKFDNVKLIIAPRHPERFSVVEKILKDKGLTYIKRTDNDKIKDVMILNTIGELSIFFSICDIAFIGGSLVNIGGHNIIEPAIFSKPVIFGPHMHNFRDIANAFITEKGGLIVTKNNLTNTLKILIEDRKLRQEIGNNARKIVEKNKGSLEKTINFIFEQIT